MATLQSDVNVNQVNAVLNVASTLAQLRAGVAALVALNATTPLANLWNTLKTTALNADGSLGTADGSPTSTNPIDTRVYPGLSRAVKPADLTNALQAVVDFNNFLLGNAISANASRPGQLNNVAM